MVGTANFTKLIAIVLGDVPAARTVTTSAEAARGDGNVQSTLQKLADFFNGRSEGTDGFSFTLVTGDTQFDPDDLDVSVTPVNVFGSADPAFLADLYAVITWINVNSSLATAARATGATGGAPTNTAAPVFLQGGVEGTTTQSNYQTALDLLKQTRVNSIVAWSSDPAVHAAMEAHCAFMSGIGRSERDCFVGLQNTAQTDVPTKTEAKAQIVDLNSRHVRAFAQAVDRFNTAGVRTEFQSFALATLAAGMQAGSPVGTSLTFKFPNILNFRQDTSWNPSDDGEEMIQAGLVFVENVEGTGRRFVRNITTFLQSNNLAFTEGSVNEAANFAVFQLRNDLEFSVGQKGFAGTPNAAGGVAIKSLGLLVDSEIITAWRALNVELKADVLEVSVEIAPVIPTNFVKTTVHLVVA